MFRFQLVALGLVCCYCHTVFSLNTAKGLHERSKRHLSEHDHHHHHEESNYHNDFDDVVQANKTVESFVLKSLVHEFVNPDFIVDDVTKLVNSTYSSYLKEKESVHLNSTQQLHANLMNSLATNAFPFLQNPQGSIVDILMHKHGNGTHVHVDKLDHFFDDLKTWSQLYDLINHQFIRSQENTFIRTLLENGTLIKEVIADTFLSNKYGNGTNIFVEGLEHMLQNLGHFDHNFNHSIEYHKNGQGEFINKHDNHNHEKVHDDHGHNHGHSHPHDDDLNELKDHVGNISKSVGKNTCLSAVQMFDMFKININRSLTKVQFFKLCPVILSQLDQKSCKPQPLQARKGSPNSSISAWIGALASVGVISLAGLIVISIVPILSKSKYFDHVTQFLISLAVGTLTSDALLHLLPHAMVPHSHGDGQEALQTGVLNHKYVSELSINALWVGMVAFLSIILFFVIERVLKMVANKNQRLTQEQIEINYMTEEGQATFQNGSTKPSVHSNSLHNHSHHVPSGILSSAWMVAMGDGLHNFADGLAIGASFANSLSVGLSTSVAVLCHELPHELGDFASLLTAGMSVKQAIVCNLVSSVMCLAGVCLGVAVGNYVQSLTMWVFAATAGIFLYIALVDMLPQMTKSYELEHEEPAKDSKEALKDSEACSKFMAFVQHESTKRLLLHLTGVGVGLTLMLVIGLYEDRIVINVV